MIREANWKLAWYPRVSRWQLFDLAADPLELCDLSGQAEQQPRADALYRKLTRWLSEQGDAVAKAAPVELKNATEAGR